MGRRGRRTTNSSLDGDGWPGSADAFASRLWQPGHRTNDWPIERDSAFRLAPYKALIEKRSYTGPATVFGHDYESDYAPLIGEDGKLIGAVFVGIPK